MERVFVIVACYRYDYPAELSRGLEAIKSAACDKHQEREDRRANNRRDVIYIIC